MENLKRSKRVALGLIDETKDIIEGTESPVTNIRLRSPKEVELSAPGTSKPEKKPTEYVKYGKITFNTTAILHHYPQMQSKNCTDNCFERTVKKSDLNLPEKEKDNNNEIKSETKTKLKIKHNENNNETVKSNCVKSSDVLKKPVKFTEEKLV